MPQQHASIDTSPQKVIAYGISRGRAAARHPVRLAHSAHKQYTQHVRQGGQQRERRFARRFRVATGWTKPAILAADGQDEREKQAPHPDVALAPFRAFARSQRHMELVSARPQRTLSYNGRMEGRTHQGLRRV